MNVLILWMKCSFDSKKENLLFLFGISFKPNFISFQFEFVRIEDQSSQRIPKRNKRKTRKVSQSTVPIFFDYWYKFEVSLSWNSIVLRLIFVTGGFNDFSKGSQSFWSFCKCPIGAQQPFENWFCLHIHHKHCLIIGGTGIIFAGYCQMSIDLHDSSFHVL